MKLTIAILLLLPSVFCEAQTFTLFAGTYTDTDSKGIYVYQFDASSGKLSLAGNTDSAPNPSFLTVSANANFVYAINEAGEKNPGTISAYQFDKANNKLNLQNTQPTGGEDPCYVSVTRDNKWAVVSNYNGGSIAVFPINDDGSIGQYRQLVQFSGSSINKKRQEKSHPHSVVLSADERFLFVPDLGTDKVMIFNFDPSSPQIITPAKIPFVKTIAGSGPRHFCFDPNKKIVYVSEELSGSVSAYKYSNGKLIFVQRIFSHPKNYKGEPASADIHVSPDGRFLYISNRGEENTITIFAIDPASGKLTLKGFQPTLGKTPRNFMIDPTGNFLLVANQNSNSIIVFKRNKQTGLLKLAGKDLKSIKPVCLQMSKG